MSLPSKLHYQSKVEPAMAKSYKSNIAPQNGTGPYQQDTVIMINIPTAPNLVFVPQESYLKFNAIITNNTGTAANYYRYDSNGAHGFIRKIRVLHGTNIIEEIDNYDLLAKMIFDIQAPNDAIQGKFNITSGTRAELSLDTPNTLMTAFTNTAATTTQLAGALNKIPSMVITPNHGQLLNGITGLAADINTPIITPTYCLNLISVLGSLCNEKYFPLFACTSSSIKVEITLCPNLLNVMASDVGGKFALDNVEYVMNCIELGDSAMEIIQNSLNGEPLQFCLSQYKNMNWNGVLPAGSTTSFSVPLNAKFSSVKSFFVATRDTSKACGNVNYFPCSSNTFKLSQYFFRIGSVIVPPRYPTNSAEYCSELLKAGGSLGDLYYTPAIDNTSYTQELPLVNNDKILTLGTHGMDGYKYSSVSSGSFFVGLDLENYCTADRTNIFAGMNTNTSDIFYTPTFLSPGAAAVNLRFDSFVLFDAVYVFQNNTVYCKF